MDNEIEKYFEKLPNMITIIKNINTDKTDRYRIYDIMTKTTFKNTSASTVKQCLELYLDSLDF